MMNIGVKKSKGNVLVNLSEKVAVVWNGGIATLRQTDDGVGNW